MKNVLCKPLLISTVLLTVISCSKESAKDSEILEDISNSETQDIENIQEIESENLIYHFEGDTFHISDNYSKGDNVKFDNILDLPNLNTYFDGSENVRLFRDAESFAEFEGKLTDNKTNISKKGGSYYGYFRIYTDSYYGGPSRRSSSYDVNGSSGPIPIYNFSHPAGGTWNDKTSSLIVYNCRVQFFEHSFSNSIDGVVRGKILTVDDRYDTSRALGYQRLKSVRVNGIRWNDKISEAQISRTYSR